MNFDLQLTSPEKAGTLPKQQLQRCVAAAQIVGMEPIQPAQLQPASIDLRLGVRAYRLCAGFLPGKRATVIDKVKDFAMRPLDLRESAVLEVGCVYLVELLEELNLPPDICGKCNPKSTIGRLDVFCRVLSDKGTEFDSIAAGYCGKLYLEVTPRTFPIVVSTGDTLAQLRLKRGSPAPQSDTQVLQVGLKNVESAHLLGARDKGLVGYRAKRHAGLIDLRRVGEYAVSDYWDAVFPDNKGRVVLDPEAFYILATRERVVIPPTLAADMLPSDAGIGEFRAHYAGFFDPGFGGANGATGARAVLEIRGRDLPFILENGQPVGKLVYETMSEVPSALYGSESGSNYQSEKRTQDLCLAKQFVRVKR